MRTERVSTCGPCSPAAAGPAGPGSTKWQLRKCGCSGGWGSGSHRAACPGGETIWKTRQFHILESSAPGPERNNHRAFSWPLQSRLSSLFLTYSILSFSSHVSHGCPWLLKIIPSILSGNWTLKDPPGFRISKIYPKHVQNKAQKTFYSPQILVQKVTIQNASMSLACVAQCLSNNL